MSAISGDREGEASAPLRVDEIVNQIGRKVSDLRKSQGLSLQQLASVSDVSAAAIHKIERSGMVPTITTLLKLGTALGVPVSYFVQEDETQPVPVHATAAGHRPQVYTPHAGLRLSGISGSYRQFQTAAAVATVEPGATSGERPMQHPGEELVHVLSGSVEFRVADQTYTLGPGDSLHFAGDVPHHWENHGRKAAELVWIALRNG